MGFPSLSQVKVPHHHFSLQRIFYFQKQIDKHYGHKPCDLGGRLQVPVFQYSDKTDLLTVSAQRTVVKVSYCTSALEELGE